VFALSDGILSKKLAEEGTTVEPGQVMFVIDNDEQHARQQAAQQIYETAKSNYTNTSPALQEAETALLSAQRKLTNDSLQFERMRDLLASKAISQAEFDKASLAYQLAQNDAAAAQKRYQKTKRQLFVELQNAESQYKVNTKQQSNYFIRSAVQGMVYEVYKSQGEVVRRNDALALVGDGRTVYLKLSVDELDVNKLRTGQQVLVKIDMYKDRVFKAAVSKIYPMLNKQDQSFRVDAVFQDTVPTSFAGLTVEANIIISQKERALVIPKALLGQGDSVNIKSSNGVQKVKIQRGIENFEFVEILSGLDENTELVTKK
jgi:HlyD family secretion protein